MGFEGGEDFVHLGQFGQAQGAQGVKLGHERLVDQLGFGAFGPGGAQGGKLLAQGGIGAPHPLQFQALHVKLLRQPVDPELQVGLLVALLQAAQTVLQLRGEGFLLGQLRAQPPPMPRCARSWPRRNPSPRSCRTVCAA